MVTRVAGVVSGDTETNESLMTIPDSTTWFALATLSTKITTAPFIRAADLTLLCPTTAATARPQSSTELGKVVEIFKPCRRLSSPNATMLAASRPAAAGRSRKKTSKSHQSKPEKHKKTFTHPNKCHSPIENYEKSPQSMLKLLN